MWLRNILMKIKPGMPVTVHLLVAAMIWCLVGSFLMLNGFLLMSMAGREWLALPAIVLGTIKSRLIMDRMALRNSERIRMMDDGACIGSVYSVRTWGLVVMMILLGRYLRRSVLPGEIIATIYLAIGWALFVSSRIFWRQWLQLEKGGGKH